MGCCDSDSVQVSKMALELKSGPMLWHKKRFFGSNWRDVHSVLYNDSSLCWYKDMSRQEQEGGIVLKEAPELIAYGPYTSQVPDRPPLPDNYEPKQMLAFGVRGKDVVYWFLCPNQEEVMSWMAAIASTMPPPPGAPQAPMPVDSNSHPNNLPQQLMPQPQMPQQPTSPAMSQHPGTAPPYVPQQPPPQYTPSQQQPSYAPRQAPGIPGQYPPPTSYRPPPYQGYNTVHPQPYPASGGGGTTVVVQQDRPGYIGGGGGGGGDFAMGMLLGGAIGTAWGSRPTFGVGLGFGGGWGHGGGWSNHSTNVHDTDVTINNYYDNDSTVINNNLDMTNNVDIDQTQAQQPAIEQAPVPQALPPQEDLIVEDYVPVEDSGYDGGGGYEEVCDDYGGGGFADDYGGGDYGGDFGGDFGDF